MLIDVVLLVVGLVLLFAGGEGLVRGAVSLANRLHLSPLVIGLTVVGFGTSTPELLVSLKAAMHGSPDIAIGNVVGSNTANILLILGIAALISPMVVRVSGLARDLAVMTLAAAAALAFGFLGGVERIGGALMFAALVVYLAYAAIAGRRDGVPVADLPIQLTGWKEALLIVGGLAALMFGADTLVNSATRIARDFGVSEAVIGLTIVAIGTSLPELATSIVAALRRHSEVAIGNVVGSNIFNIFGILGVTAMVKPVQIAPEIARFDIPLMLGLSLALAVLMLAFGRISRLIGAVFLAAYAAYVAFLF